MTKRDKIEKNILLIAGAIYGLLWILSAIPGIQVYITQWEILKRLGDVFVLLLLWKIIEISADNVAGNDKLNKITKSIEYQHSVLNSFSKILGFRNINLTGDEKLPVKQTLEILTDRFERDTKSVLTNGELEIVGYQNAIDVALRLAKNAQGQLIIKSHISPTEWRNGKMKAALDIYLGQLKAMLEETPLTRIIVLPEDEIASWTDEDWKNAKWFEEKIKAIGGKLLLVSSAYDEATREWMDRAVVLADPENASEIQYTTQPPDISSQHGALVFNKEKIDSGVNHIQQLLSFAKPLNEFSALYQGAKIG